MPQIEAKEEFVKPGAGIIRIRSAFRSTVAGLALLCASSGGGAAVSLAVSAPVLLGAVGVASDFAIFTMKKSNLQAAADTAALAAARELSVISTGGSSGSGSGMASAASSAGGPIESIAKSYVEAALSDASDATTTSAAVDPSSGSVTVTISDHWKPFFAHFLGADITPINVDARAELVGETKICVIGLSPSGIGAVAMTKSAKLEANGCGIYSNSTSSQGFYLGKGSEVKASLVCSAGGVFNQGATAGTNVLTDCPPVADPLADRKPPSYGGCDYKATIIKAKTVTLKPGVYCGGLTVMDDARVTFSPGNYIIKDGPFSVKDSSRIKGSNVAFYLTGAASLLQFKGEATIDLSGAESGEMAGLLFFEDPASSPLRIHSINAAHAFNLTGTIYLSRGTLVVDPVANVADKSAYTAIIVKRLVVDNGPSLVLNTDYGATKVPVPDGIRSSSDVVLAE